MINIKEVLKQVADISKVKTPDGSVYNIRDRVSYVELTQAQYDALGPEKYQNDVDYFITDGDINDTIIYGWHVNPGESDPEDAVIYLKDAVGMTPAAMGSSSFNYGTWQNAFFMPRPCMLKYDGTVDYYLNPNNYAEKADGSASDIANPNYQGNAMMEFPLIYWKYRAGSVDGEGYFYCSNKKVDNDYECWCNYDSEGNQIEHFYIGIYDGVIVDNKMRSLSGYKLTPANGNGNTSGTTEVAAAEKNNSSTKKEWYISTYSDTILLYGLLVLMGKSLNLQSTFGRGLDTGGQAAAQAYTTGSMNSNGLFWGTTTNGNNGVKIFGIENFWGCKYRRIAGLLGRNNGGYLYKMTYSNKDGSTATSYNSNGSNYLVANINRPDYGYVSKMGMSKYGILPIQTSGGSSAKYYCDFYVSGVGYALFGGSAGNGLYCGCYWTLGYAFSGSSWNFAAALSCRPVLQN